MKPRIRKFLAGLLSLGMLLQAASPLSALAASSPGTAPELTVTTVKNSVTNTYTLTVGEDRSVTNTDSTAWTTDGLPTVTYADTGFVFSGVFKVDSLSITGTGSEDVTLDGNTFCVAMTTSAGDMTGDGLVISNVQNVTIKSATERPLVRGSVSITARGNVDIQNPYHGYTYDNASISKSLTVDTTGSLTMNCTTGPAVGENLTVKNASVVDLHAVTQYGVIGDTSKNGSAKFDNCGSVVFSNTYTSSSPTACAIYTSLNTPLAVTAPAGKTIVYSKKTSSSGSYQTADASDCTTCHYFTIDFASDADQCNITVNGLAVTMGNKSNIGGTGLVFTPDDTSNPGAGGTLTSTRDLSGQLAIVVSGSAKNRVALNLSHAVPGINTSSNALAVTGASDVTITGTLGENYSSTPTDLVTLTECSGKLTYQKPAGEKRLYSVMNGDTYVTPADQPAVYTLDMNGSGTIIIGLCRSQYVRVDGGSAYMDAKCEQKLTSDPAIGTTVYLKPDALTKTNQKFYGWTLTVNDQSESVTEVDAANGIYSFTIGSGISSATYMATAVYSYGFSLTKDNGSPVEVTTANSANKNPPLGSYTPWYDPTANKLQTSNYANFSLTVTVDPDVNNSLDVEFGTITDNFRDKTLTVTGARNVTVKDLNCAAVLDVTGDVKLGDASSSIGGTVNIKNAHNVTLFHNFWSALSVPLVNCTGDVNITASALASDTQYGSVHITTNGDVNITGTANGKILENSAYITCKNLTIDGTGAASPNKNIVGYLEYTGSADVLRGGQSSTDTGYLASTANGTITLNGSSASTDGTYCRYLTTHSETPHTVTLNEKAAFASGNGSRYVGQPVSIKAEDDTEALVFDRFAFAASASPDTELTGDALDALHLTYDSTDKHSASFTMPDYDVTVTAVYTTVPKHTVTLPEGVTTEGGTSGSDAFHEGQEVTIKADTSDASKVFEKFEFEKTGEPGESNTKLTEDELTALKPQPDPDDPSKVTITMPGYDLTVKVVYRDAESYGFKVNGVDANENTLPDGLSYADGKLTASADYDGDLNIEVTTAPKLDVDLKSVSGALTLTKVNNVTITGTVGGKLTVGSEDTSIDGSVVITGRIAGGTEINCTGSVTATGDVSFIDTPTGSIISGILCGNSIIRCGGEVYLENAGSGYTTGPLTIEGATNVTVKANGTFHAAISGDGTITCSGTVDLVTTGKAAMGSRDTLIYNPMSNGSYTVKLDDRDPVTHTGTYKGIAAEDGELNELYEVQHILITPVNSGNPDPGDDTDTDTGTGSGSVSTAGNAGGAAAAAAIGAAAVWGGYQVATRVVLHNLLPAGADIPTTRGALALLVWNNAGKPEPLSAPVFTDVADADMAKAAQWCVEQGLLDAKTESTFKPDGLVTKVKVIEVWSKAFPKN